tara:strand:+ start:3433 stop:3720 length:288 start_codon:yes stop_codon:yes gene_type:complete
MKIEKNFTTGVLSGICGILLFIIITGASPNTNYGLVPINDDGSISVSISDDQLNKITNTLQEAPEVQQVEIVGYDNKDNFKKVRVTKRGKLDVNI